MGQVSRDSVRGFFLGMFVGLVLGGLCVRADVSRYPLTSPSTTLTCPQELSAIRESMFQSSMGEALLSKAVGSEDNFNFYLSRAHTVRHSDELQPSPAVCSFGNLKTLRIMAADWEYEYLLDSAAVAKWENR